MRFRHALVHPTALARADAAAWRTALRITCPLCAEPYYAGLLAGVTPEVVLQALTVAVQAYLARECPDHAHTFEW